MTGTPPSAGDSATRSATIRTTVEEPDVVAASVRPDNTPEIETRVEETNVENDDDAEDDDAEDDDTEVAYGGEADDETETDDETEVGDDAETGVVVTTVERDTTGGLRTTVDDYVVNLAVAQEVVQVANRHADTQTDGTHDQ